MKSERIYVEVTGALGAGKTSLAKVFQEKADFIMSIESGRIFSETSFRKALSF